MNSRKVFIKLEQQAECKNLKDINYSKKIDENIGKISIKINRKNKTLLQNNLFHQMKNMINQILSII